MNFDAEVLKSDKPVPPECLKRGPLLDDKLVVDPKTKGVRWVMVWLQDPANASLRGDQLVQALQPMPWDASVKSLVAYPQILSMLDSNLLRAIAPNRPVNNPDRIMAIPCRRTCQITSLRCAPSAWRTASSRSCQRMRHPITP